MIDARPGSSSLPTNNKHGRNGRNTKACTFERKDKTVPLIEKEIEKLIIPALKDELAIIDLARGIENASNSKIVISKLTARDNDYSGTVKAVNKHHQNKWKLIGHANINLKDLTKVDYTSTGKVTTDCKRTL